MNRELPTFEDASQRVKISVFAKIGLDIKGIIHVGTNYGYEMKWYQQMGIENLIGFEPLASACAQFHILYPEIMLYTCALGERIETLEMTVYAGDGQGSSLLKEINPDPNAMVLVTRRVSVVPFDCLDINMARFDCLVIDVEGFESHVLAGFGDCLNSIDMISVELSETPRYIGQQPALAVVHWLAQKGFRRLSRIEAHNDVFFLRATLYDQLMTT